MSQRWFPDDMPAPAVSRETLPWWQAAARHHLVLQECMTCRRAQHPPGPICRSCRGGDLTWREVSGRGSLYTYTVVQQAFLPSLAPRLPYVIAVVELEGGDGARLMTNLVDVDPADLRIGMDVEVVWEDMGPALALPRFRPLGPRMENEAARSCR